MNKFLTIFFLTKNKIFCENVIIFRKFREIFCKNLQKILRKSHKIFCKNQSHFRLNPKRNHVDMRMQVGTSGIILWVAKVRPLS